MSTPAEAMNCPMCGAPVASNATQCDHCGARLATVACPSCFGMIFAGAKFCPHCGAAVERTEVKSDEPRPCPRCRVPMSAVLVGKVHLLECAKCEGIWADGATLEKICADREEQAAVLGTPGPWQQPESVPIETVRYVPCPVCGKLMNRVNFANCSHVVVDVCKAHGTWFDKDELRRIVEFIRAGGLEKARQIEIDQLERERMRLEFEKASSRSSAAGMGLFTTPDWGASKYGVVEHGISAAASVLRSFLH